MSAAPAEKFPAIGSVRQVAREWLPLALAFAVLFATALLPTDTALRQVDEVGRIAVCMPVDYPPLVGGSEEAPGFDVDLVREIAARSGWNVHVVANPAMGRDFNPRAWRVTRAQCQMLAGGIALSNTTRSFLDTTNGHLTTGWVMASADDAGLPQSGQRAGFYAGLSGLDRVQLGQYLREQGVTPRIVPTAAALREGLANGDFDIAVTEALIAYQTFDEEDWTLSWLPGDLGRVPIGIGFWKGDMTLRRHVQRVLDAMEADGTIAALAARYRLSDDVRCDMSAERCPKPD